jgi:hypothetical protein
MFLLREEPLPSLQHFGRNLRWPAASPCPPTSPATSTTEKSGTKNWKFRFCSATERRTTWCRTSEGKKPQKRSATLSANTGWPNLEFRIFNLILFYSAAWKFQLFIQSKTFSWKLSRKGI